MSPTNRRVCIKNCDICATNQTFFVFAFDFNCDIIKKKEKLMDKLKELRIVDNFYQTSAFYPMPTILISTVSDCAFHIILQEKIIMQ